MKTAATATIICLCCVAAALIATPTVAFPTAEDGVGDAAATTVQTPTAGEERTTAATTESNATTPPETTAAAAAAEPEVTTSPQAAAAQPDATTPPQTAAAEPEVTTSPQSIVEPEVAPAAPAVTAADDVLSTTSKPPAEAVGANATAQVPAPESAAINATQAEAVRDKLSEQIRRILKHYQQPNPVGFPGMPIPDPMSLPDMKKSLGIVDLDMRNITVHGMSKFEVDHINVDLKNMTVYVLLKIKRLYVLGNYTLNKMWGRPDTGPFNATLLDVEAAGTAELKPDAAGRAAQAADTEVDMGFDGCELDFANMSPLYRDTVNSFGPALFELIKPFVTGEVNDAVRDDVNARLRAVSGRMPALSAPVPDLLVDEARAYVRRAGYDPYRVPDRRVRTGPLDASVANLTVVGLSRFRRVGDVGLEVRDGRAVRVTVHVVTGAVNGTADWSCRLGSLHRAGRCNVSVDHVQVRAVVDQPLDVRRRPELDRLDLEVGRVTVTTDRREPVDFAVESALNALPELVRHVIVDALEEPIRIKVQTVLDQVQVDRIIEDRLIELDRLVGDSQ